MPETRWSKRYLVYVVVMLTLVDDPWLGLWLLVPVTFCMAMPNGLMLASLQSVAPINYSMAFLALGFSLRYYRAALDQAADWS